MDERGGLERVARGFGRHLVRSHTAQFVVDHRQQFVSGLAVALVDDGEDVRHAAHGSAAAALVASAGVTAIGFAPRT